MSAAKRGAWVASARSMEINRWTRLLDRARVTPMFVQLGGVPADAFGVMSFSCAHDAAALADLLRALELDALIVSGIDVLPTVLAVARAISLPVMVVGATPAEDRALAHLLPSQYVDRRQRANFIVIPDIARAIAVRDLEFVRSKPRAKLRNRIANRHDAWNVIARAFPAFTAQADLRARHQEGYLLQPSGNIQRVASHSYRVTFAHAQACHRVTLLPIVESPKSSGLLRVEMISPTGTVAAAERRLNTLCALSATEFILPPLTIEAGSTWELRVSVRDGDAPVRLLEMRRYRLFGWAVDLQPCTLFAQV
jgi:hypothetical protein